MLRVDNDGLDHINIYSRARTRLGRLLSNHAPLAFTHPTYGSFSCAESYWYWLSTGQLHDGLRVLPARQARFQGKQHPKVIDPLFKRRFAEGLICKLNAHPDLTMNLANSRLPFKHYYWFGKVEDNVIVEPPGHEWQMALWEHWRTELQANQVLTVPDWLV